jgi:tetratricopeptide (TPR) repeat protein
MGVLEDCLRAAAQDEPLLIVVQAFTDRRALATCSKNWRALATAACFVLHRPPVSTARCASALPNFTKSLSEPAPPKPSHSRQTVTVVSARGGALPSGLVDKLTRRSQGNPFYLEELLNFLHDRGLDPLQPAGLNQIELPDSLNTLILSRIDQLSEREKTTLRVASIVGRLFRAAWLTGYYPIPRTAPGKIDRITGGDDITLLDTPSGAADLFKHIVTHEVTREFGFSTARLHDQFAGYLEKQIAAGTLHESSLLDTLVYHYTSTDNRAKQREYLRKAAQAAQDVSAFTTAVEYLARLLELIPATDPTRSALAVQLAVAHYNLGDYTAARAAIERVPQRRPTPTARPLWRSCEITSAGRLRRSADDSAQAVLWRERAATN